MDSLRLTMRPKSSISGHEVYPRNKEIYSGTLLAVRASTSVGMMVTSDFSHSRNF